MLTDAELKQKLLSEASLLLRDKTTALTDDTPLLGDGSVLDSMSLVELCLTLEDFASDHGFKFNWTSESAMSQKRSMFRTIGTLSEAFIAQSKAKAA